MFSMLGCWPIDQEVNNIGHSQTVSHASNNPARWFDETGAFYEVGSLTHMNETEHTQIAYNKINKLNLKITFMTFQEP